MRHHAVHTERILALAPALADVARVAASDHERPDGSGYPRAVSGAAVGRSARLLAAADVYHALLEDRPHRAALAGAAAARVLRDEVSAGRLDAFAVDAMLALERPHRARSAWPADLTDREVEVLRELTRGLTNKEIGARLGISPRTVQQHTVSIYGKTGTATRGAAAMFATEHDLLAVWA
jgi:DNA-binding CsgD family transcriptional regulator